MKKDDTYLKIVKFVGRLALICTLLLFTFLVVESCLPGELSGAFTSFITGKVDSSLDLSNKLEEGYKTQSITIVATSHDGSRYYVGETILLNASYYPTSTRDTEVEFSVDNPRLATVDVDGKVTFLNKGTVQVTMSLKSDPSIYDTKNFWCVGENVFDAEHPERKVFTLSGVGANHTLKVGQYAKIMLNDDKTFVEIASLQTADPSVAFLTENRVFARSAGETEIIATLTSSDGKKETYTLPVVVENSDYCPISEIILKNTIDIVDGSDVIDYRTLFEIEDGRTSEDYICKVTSSDRNIINISNYRLMVRTWGTVTLTFQSVYNPDVAFERVVHVQPIQPESLTIVGADTIQPHGVYRYTAYHAPEKYSDSIQWSVVKGAATIDENGRLVATFFGNVTIRCQSVLDESLCVEKTIHVGFATSASSIVRKLMGHMGLHALLGFGVTFTLLFVLKRKRFMLLSPDICLLSTVLTEFIQYFTPDRYCRLTDMVTDFSGALIGILVAVLLMGLIVGVWYLLSKRGCKELLSAVKETNWTNLFEKTPKVVDLNTEVERGTCCEIIVSEKESESAVSAGRTVLDEEIDSAMSDARTASEEESKQVE